MNRLRQLTQIPMQRLQTVLLGGFAVIAYLLLCRDLYYEIVGLNGGHFLYALDDPYIHLALTNGIAAGHYGLNAGEAASPSSSILWPFLLLPFAHVAWEAYAPLLLNVLAGIATACLLGAAVARWPYAPDEEVLPVHEAARRVISVAALIFIGNLLGLTFVGMEHTLQILLATAGAWGVISCLSGRRVPLWCLFAAALGPSVRYESVGITVALCIALVGQREIRRAAIVLVASLLPLLLFSAFLHHLGLPLMPTSVMVKSQVPGTHGVKQQGAQLILDGLRDTFVDPHRTVVFLLFATLTGLAWYERDRVRRFALGGAALAAGLHLLVGRFNWFFRYEVYIVLFSALIVLYVVHERARGLLGWYVIGLFGCSLLYFQAFSLVPYSSNQIYRQQYQTHRFVDEFYTGNSVAVNDLGLVSYDRRPGLYVLDLVGLGSVEAALQPNKTTAWLDAIVHEHHAGVVAIYPRWFQRPPADWTLLGELCLPDAPIAVAGSCVRYYATPDAPLAQTQDEFDDFVTTLPPGVGMIPRAKPAQH